MNILFELGRIISGLSRVKFIVSIMYFFLTQNKSLLFKYDDNTSVDKDTCYVLLKLNKLNSWMLSLIPS